MPGIGRPNPGSSRECWLCCACLTLVVSDRVVAQSEAAPEQVQAAAARAPDAGGHLGNIPKADIDAAVQACAQFLLARQESLDDPQAPPEARAEWPYEGVYRVRRQIPIGYRVGGTAIVAHALLEAPGLQADAPRRGAITRAAEFVSKSIEHPLMSPDYDGGYDVRGWGYTYALHFLLRCADEGVLPEDRREPTRQAIEFYVRAIQETAIARVGGWSYSRPAGKERVAPPSPFMTAPTIDALIEAHARGHAVDAGGVEAALATLERARTPSGAVVYAGFAAAEGKGRGADPTPGAVGRMLASACTLHLAGRATQAEVRGALDAFLVHWDWLDQRRAKPGTHEGPYAIAPYYFYYAHRAAARAIELLPEHERAEYRRRLYLRLFSVRQEDGTWNDRVFPRSASFGTANALLVLRTPEMKPPARWAKPEELPRREGPREGLPAKDKPVVKPGAGGSNQPGSIEDR